MILEKIITRDKLSIKCQQFRQQKLKIGFTSGAFDLLHSGHVDYLEKAKSQCDVLIVGLNSDQSIKKYKGDQRPIIPQTSRAKVIAALESVDYIFIFEERRNEQNIRSLKPDFYFKAGDYKAEQLTSKSVIEELGGEVKLIPVEDDISTSAIINKITGSSKVSEHYLEDQPDVGHFQRRPSKMSPAIFLDRDGTINKDIGYASEPEKFEFLPRALEGIKKIFDMEYRLVVITNQGGIGLGYFTKEDFYNFNKKMMTGISKAGAKLDKILFCPHSLSEDCNCRKPALGLVERAQQDLNLDLSHSYFIGDREMDIETGNKAGMKTILIKGETNSIVADYKTKPDFIVNDLLEAATIILGEERK
jgi:rfaE bifunctional protein nucleotidyltransferase chain/domain